MRYEMAGRKVSVTLTVFTLRTRLLSKMSDEERDIIKLTFVENHSYMV